MDGASRIARGSRAGGSLTVGKRGLLASCVVSNCTEGKRVSRGASEDR